MPSYGVYFSWPPSYLFKFPPNPHPAVLPSPSDARDIRSPFAIDPVLYNKVFDPAVPITFAAGYFLLVKIANQVNRRRDFKPWAISRWRSFHLFTIIHNILLALYSAATFVAMVRAIHVSVPLDSFAGAVDSLCQMHGPRGFGDAVTYNRTSSAWETKNPLIHLLPGSDTPDATDVGRIWNEGLAFWGWFFYLSKFYEVLDTFIILAKGKRSSTLQTFHHAGAMFCMWSGMRYMSPPIWMFVLVNSFIHSLMYTFYTATTFGISVPGRIKRTITTLQISQFLLGISYASLHLFISYDVPVSLPIKIASLVAHPAVASQVATDAIAGVKQVAQSSGSLPSWVKRLVYRAVGAEGLAESVRDSNIYTDRQAVLNSYGTPAEHAEKIEYRLHSQTVRCIDTEGSAFAIWLNLAYLAPLTGLFVRFFVKSYLRKDRGLTTSVQDAARKTQSTVEKLGEEVEHAADPLVEVQVEKEGQKKKKNKNKDNASYAAVVKDNPPASDSAVVEASI